MADEKQDMQWHLDRRISIGHLITTLTVVVGALLYSSRQDTRISLLEQMTQENRQRYEQMRDDVAHRLDKMDGKLDRLLEQIVEGVTK